jgi:hypothetical protein
MGFPRSQRNSWFVPVLAAAVLCFSATETAVGSSGAKSKKPSVKPDFIKAVAFDVSPPLRRMAAKPHTVVKSAPPDLSEIRKERGRIARDSGFSGDGALQGPAGSTLAPALAIASPSLTFEGVSNLDNFNIFGFRVNPPDPVGDVGPNHYVEMINLVYAVYDKAGNLLVGPVDTGTLWSDFPIEDCTDPSGDPIVIHDQLEDRWVLSQFTTRGLNPDGSFNGLPFYNCVAISVTGDPTGAYYRYAFLSDLGDVVMFPDYPKYGNWKKTYVLTSRDFGINGEYGISVYALEKNKMIAGNPNARAIRYFIDGNDPDLLPLVGDGLLPADLDGTKQPKEDAAIPIVGTQDVDAGYGATFDALNIWDLKIHWQANPVTSLVLNTQLPTLPFDSVFPCGPSRGCLAQPGVANPDQWLDVLSYRQRPIWRLAYRTFKGYDSMVTNQSVQATEGGLGVAIAGTRWYEIRRVGTTYTIHQQGTYSPPDGVHRWMGSIAQDKNGNMALGYSVVNGTTVFPGIRYTGRLAGDALGTMSLGEATVVDGTGVQTTTNSRWGDYTSMNIDPVDDCTFWYVNEWYQVSGLPLPLPPPPLPPPGTTAPWQTKIAKFKLPGC